MDRQRYMAEQIARQLDDPCRWHIEVRHCVDSTNRVLKESAATGASAGEVLMAEMQTAGRGRMNRSFFSPDRSGLYMSFLLRPTLPAADAQLMTLAAAVSAAEAMETMSGRDIAIKWVNDLFLDGRKICGILTESALRLNDGYLSYAVVGIGVNLFPPAEGFPVELAGIAGALFPACRSAEKDDLRAKLCAEILNRFSVYADRLEARDFLDAYRRRSMVIGHNVILSHTGERVLVTDIDDNGALCVKDSAGNIRLISSGECSIFRGE